MAGMLSCSRARVSMLPTATPLSVSSASEPPSSPLRREREASSVAREFLQLDGERFG
jgi:hypothetical protein